MSRHNQEVTILLVEDDDIDAKCIERELQKQQLLNPLCRAKNGSEALAILRTKSFIERPYIILLDLNMPIMSGLDFLDIIREDKHLKSATVFVLTTSEADEDRVAAYRRQVAGYIVKANIKDGFPSVVTMLQNM